MFHVLSALTVLLGGLLLFVLQPMVAKPLLPHLGGSSMVWNTLLLLFQGLLLAGYFYAWVWKALPLKIAAIGQVVLLVLCAFVALPLNVDAVDHVKSSAPWLSTIIYGLSVVGLPFLFLSTTVSMVQRLEILHIKGKEPYSLYAFSNAGSLMGLLLYPLLLEPYFTLSQQINFWAIGASVWGMSFIALLAWTGFTKEVVMSAKEKVSAAVRPSWKELGYWALLAFIPSSLMHGVTFYITSDIAAFPMFWILPLGIFLLTYIIAFSGYQIKNLAKNAVLVRALVLVVFFCMILGVTSSLSTIAIHLVTYFIVALHVHVILYNARPEKHHLEIYYLSIAVGGVIGGVFHVLLAPLVFTNWMWEYPLSLAVALFVGPMPLIFKHIGRLKLYAPIPFAAILLGIAWAVGAQSGLGALLIFFIICCIITFPHRVLLSIVLMAGICLTVFQREYLHTDRSFYGFYRVFDLQKTNARYLQHGSTTHGIQSLDINRKGWSYYKPAYAAFDVLDPSYSQLNIAMIGLGTGGMADFYGNIGKAFDIYEIDPTVIDISRNSGLFTYLEQAESLGVNVSYTLGDGRLNLKNSNKKYDVILLDAFSSDAVPIHMLTIDAMKVYMEHLTEKGIVLYNVSNRHFDFSPLLFKQAYELGLYPAHHYLDTDLKQLIYASNWVGVSANKSLVMSMKENYEWGNVAPEVVESAPLWTDEKNSALKVLKALR